MTWLKGLLIALGLVVVLVVGIIAALGLLTSDKGKEVRHISIGQRTITVSHYQEPDPGDDGRRGQDRGRRSHHHRHPRCHRHRRQAADLRSNARCRGQYR